MPQERRRVELEAVAEQAGAEAEAEAEAEAQAEAAEGQAWHAWTRQLLRLERLEVVEHRRSPQLHFCSGGRMCSTKGLLSLSRIVFMLPWFNDASIASDAANLFWLANTSLSHRDSLPHLGHVGSVFVRGR